MPLENKLSCGDLSGPRADGLRGEERATVHGAVEIALGVAVWHVGHKHQLPTHLHVHRCRHLRLDPPSRSTRRCWHPRWPRARLKR